MSLLAYCMMEAASEAMSPVAGVGGARVEELRDAGLSCWFSRFSSREQISRIPAVESALAFHRVVEALFSQAALIPFRFPTVVEEEEELLCYLRKHSREYEAALARFRQMVQMEIRIGEPQERESAGPPVSGREYLAGRRARVAGLAALAARFRQSTEAWITDWREHQTRQGMRCYALVPRTRVGGFREAAQELSNSIPGSRVSGPWPATEFLEGIKDF